MTNVKQPTHEEISLRAYQLWKERGAEHGNDQELWFEAERQLQAAAAFEADENQGHAPPADGNPEPKAQVAHSPSVVDAKQQQIEQQKKAARAPMVPTHAAPAAKPPVSRKPIYPVQHSS
jgi:hypothetical protein